MTVDKRKTQLLELFSTMSGKTKIVEPMKNIHGTLRDSDAIEREVALVMREIIEQGIFKTSLKPIQLAKLVTSFYAGKNDTEIARELGADAGERFIRTEAATAASADVVTAEQGALRAGEGFEHGAHGGSGGNGFSGGHNSSGSSPRLQKPALPG